jgi:uncharacterized membrane protein
MQVSIFLARLLGPTLLLVGIGMFINRAGYRAMVREFLASRALIYIAGVLAFIPGLALVLAHNVWTADWRVLITLFGWLAVIGGVIRILFPQEVTRIGTRIINSPTAYSISGAVMLAIGAFLSFHGFSR